MQGVKKAQRNRKCCHLLSLASVQHRLYSDVIGVSSTPSLVCVAKHLTIQGSFNSSIKHWKDRETETGFSSFVNSLKVGVHLWKGTNCSHNLPYACGPCEGGALCAWGWATDGTMWRNVCTAVVICALQMNGGRQTVENTILSPLKSIKGLIDLIYHWELNLCLS